MGSLDKHAIFVICLTIRDKHPQSFHHLALNNHLRGIRSRLVPYMLRDPLHKLQVIQILVKTASRVLLLWVLRELHYCSLMVLNEKSEELINSLNKELVA